MYMDYNWFNLSLLILFIILGLKLWLQTVKKHKNLPPSPPRLPILGHLHLIKKPLHRCLQNISQKYGPVVSLQLGCRLVVAVSSPKIVEECFTTNDVVLANRPETIISQYVAYNHTTMITSSYGQHWRNLRRIGSLEIFSSSRLNIFSESRKEEMRDLIKKLCVASELGFTKVDLHSMFLELTYNIIMRMVTGKRYYSENFEGVEEARKLKKVIKEVALLAETSNLVDVLPIFKWIDLQGYVKRVKELGREAESLYQGFIDEQRNGKVDGTSGNNMVSHLLGVQEKEPHVYTDEVIKGLIMAIVLAGTDTTYVTLEWAMSNLLNHPHVLTKAKEELDTQVGMDRIVQESDISTLQYLQNIISETLRLYPPAPLLLPHVASKDCSIAGYDVPCGTMVFVNVWAIHRDPNLWDDPTSFRPERYETREPVSYNMLPFGLGRRACPGSVLANRIVSLALASLIQCFEWRRVSEEVVDMTEGSGLTMPKAQPLEAMCKVRKFVNNVLVKEEAKEKIKL